MSIRILSLLVVFASLTGMAAGRGENSVRHRLQPVDVYVPRDGSTVWDMTQSAPCGNEVDARVTFSGDSLIEIAMPTVRYLYAVEADTLTRLLTETRFVILNDSLPLTAATPLRTEPLQLTAVTTRQVTLDNVKARQNPPDWEQYLKDY